MSGILTHSPADVSAKALVDFGIGSDPENVDSQGNPLGAWPIYAHMEPEGPDNLIVVQDAEGRGTREIITGLVARHHGLKVMIRSTTSAVGRAKAGVLQGAMETGMYGANVTLEGVTYRLHCFSNIGDVIPVGLEDGSNRFVHSINVMVTVRML